MVVRLLLSLAFIVQTSRSRTHFAVDLGSTEYVENYVDQIRIIANRDSKSPPLEIRSDIPVTALRYHETEYGLMGTEPVQPGDMYLYIKSNCAKVDVSVDYSYQKLHPDVEVVTKISIGLGQFPPTDFDDTLYLIPSSFSGSWNYTSFWCRAHSSGFRQSVKVTTAVTGLLLITLLFNGERGHHFIALVAVIVMLLVSLVAFTEASTREGAMTTPQQTQHDRELQGNCAINAEILYDGCLGHWVPLSPVLNITAPEVRVLDSVIAEETDSQNPDDKCTTDYEATLVFPAPTTATIVPSGEIYPVDNEYGQCNKAVEGRPFVDKSGQILQSFASVDDARETSMWSAKNSNAISDAQADQKEETRALGMEWTRRGLAEHASIASFAAFTMALMSNNAPSTLIKDALVAASDEFRHAKVSFEIASLLLGQTVEPGPFPSSSHEFGPNLTALAIATAKEGCLDETLSALSAAYEVDYEIDKFDGVNITTKALLKAKMRTIVVEEGSHSMLAWRTVRWACLEDTRTCKIVLRDVLTSQRIDEACQSRFPRYKRLAVQEEAEKIFAALAATIKADKGTPLMGCGESDPPAFQSRGKLLEQLADAIIHGVICSHENQALS